MEYNSESMINESTSPAPLSISKTSVSYLTETGKWSKFLSIIGFVFTGLVVLIGIFAGSIMPSMTEGQMRHMPFGPGIIFGVVYIGMGLLYFFPTLYLFRFSQKLKIALSNKDNDALDTAFSNQKSLYKFYGIIMILVISLYVLIGLFALLAVFI